MLEQLKNITVLFVFLLVTFGVGVLVGLKLPENETYQRWNSANKAKVAEARPTDVAVMQMPGSGPVKVKVSSAEVHANSCPGGVCKLPTPNDNSGQQDEPPKKELNLTFYEALGDKPTESGGSVIRVKKTPIVENKKKGSAVVKSEKLVPESGSSWELRICSLAQEVKARLVRSELMKTYPGIEIEAVQVVGKGTWYRVKISDIKDLGEAERYQRELIKAHKYKPMIVKQ